jgi:hypothetical protein
MFNPSLQSVLSAIDDINKEDPNQSEINQKTSPKELIYGQLMSQCLHDYWPNANVCLQVAVRGQHIKRWHIPRDQFPLGKAGYLKWRKTLGQFHAQTTKELMLNASFSEIDAEKTAAIIRKEKLKTNADSQTLEDVACLVFLQYYFDPFAAKHDDEKVIRIIRLTWNKMSPRGHEIALSLTLPPHLAALVNKALSQ